ncbi:MAG: MFS transporter [Beijerinckiaceae bacterium]|nr:MFS transporter [Beijerinckiaceae bacterium]
MASPAAFAAFRYRDFTSFYIARVFNALAVQMVDVGIGWLVYTLTGSALALGLVGLCIFIPNIVFALPAGQVADMFDRKHILVVCNLVSTTAALGLLVASMQADVSVPLLFVLIGLFGTARAFANPAGQAIVPGLVPPEHLANALAPSSSAYQSAIIAGPALGGLLYAFGAPVVFGATTFCFSCALVAYLIMNRRGVTARPDKFSFAYMTAGLSFIKSKPIILGAITLDLFAVLLGGATALLPIYARDILMVGPWGLGLLRSVPALGAFTMSLVIAHRPMRRKAGLRMFQAVALFGAATIGFGLSTSFWVAAPFLFILGAADMVSVVIRSTLIQIETPDEMRGRVSAVNTVFVGASNELGQFESGLLASFVGPVMAVVLGGVGTIGVAGLCARIFPQLRHRDQLT